MIGEGIQEEVLRALVEPNGEGALCARLYRGPVTGHGGK